MIYGDGHLLARSERPAGSLTGILEAGGTKVFNVTSMFANVSQFQADASSYGYTDAARGHSARCDPADFLLGSAPPVDFFRDHPRIEEHYDALLYLGLSRR